MEIFARFLMTAGEPGGIHLCSAVYSHFFFFLLNKKKVGWQGEKAESHKTLHIQSKRLKLEQIKYFQFSCFFN